MANEWLKSYPDDVAASIDEGRYQNIIELYQQSVERYAEQAAFINMGRSITYAQLASKVDAFCAYLQSLGLVRGDRVALMMPNLLQYPIALFATLKAGLVVVNVNPLYTERELEHQLKDSGAKAIVIVSNFAHTLEKVVAKTDVEHVILTRLGDQLAKPKGHIVNFVVRYIKKMVPKYHLPDAISFNWALKKGKQLTVKPVDIQSDDIAFLQYTGGTTGVSKGAMLTHKNITSNVLQADVAYSPLLKDGEEMVVTALPLYHIFALTVNGLLFFKKGASNLLITNPRDIPGFVKELAANPFTCLTGVNTLFNGLLNNTDFCALDFSRLKLSIGGGMAVQKPVAEKWQAITKTKLLEGYGLTESSPLMACCPYNQTGFNGAIGLPAPSTQMRIIDDNGAVLPIGEVGEIQGRGPQVMKGYWQRDDETAKVIDADGWLSTGDIGYMDEAGFFYIVDRKKDMILVSGFNVFPNEVEEVIVSLEGVDEAAAVGQPHDVAGEVVKVFVVLKDKTITKADIIEHCRANLTGYKVPKVVEFRDELPKTNVGKILRRELR